ncbi:MAG: hypothetical protein QMD08_01555 [Actinomycetota bacterium]|nr:hypothetical protein [Actinomycetota bacterium]
MGKVCQACIMIQNLIKLKKNAGRKQDLSDVEVLEKVEKVLAKEEDETD